MCRKSLYILLVDDEEVIRLGLQKKLAASYGYRVDVAEDSTQALTFLDQHGAEYDVALLDESLPPPWDGIELMQDLRRRFHEVECVIFTGWGPAERQRALQSGAFRYLEKPFELDDLNAVIRAAAQQRGLRLLSRALLNEREMQPMLTHIAVAACDLTPADRAAVVLQSAPGGSLDVFPQDAEVDDEWRRHFRDSWLTRDILREGQLVRVSDTSLDARVR